MKGKKRISCYLHVRYAFDYVQRSFFNKVSNNQHFIRALGDKLSEYHCQVFHDTADADLLIVQKAIESAQTTDIVLVGDNTDLLVLLIYHKGCNK